MENFISAVPFYFILFFSVIIHECAHAIAARRLGDNTAYLMGRITLNPVKHIDPVMTIILPLITLIFSKGTFIFGGAKPVPINTYNFRNPDKGFMLSSLAGPVSNLMLALLGYMILFSAAKLLPHHHLEGFFSGFVKGCPIFVTTGPASQPGFILFVLGFLSGALLFINIILAIFNLVPIPPLDGSRVIRYFLPWRGKEVFDRMESFGIILVLVLMYSGGIVIVGYICRLLISFAMGALQ